MVGETSPTGAVASRLKQPKYYPPTISGKFKKINSNAQQRNLLFQEN